MVTMMSSTWERRDGRDSPEILSLFLLFLSSDCSKRKREREWHTSRFLLCILDIRMLWSNESHLQWVGFGDDDVHIERKRRRSRRKKKNPSGQQTEKLQWNSPLFGFFLIRHEGKESNFIEDELTRYLQ